MGACYRSYIQVLGQRYKSNKDFIRRNLSNYSNCIESEISNITSYIFVSSDFAMVFPPLLLCLVWFERKCTMILILNTVREALIR